MSECATLQLVPLHSVICQGPTERERFDMTKRIPQSGVYRISLGNDNFYLGSSANIDKRLHDHLSGLKANTHENCRLQKCWNKYGVLSSEVLEFCEIDDLLIREQFYLDRNFASTKCVNILPTAGNTAGYRHTDEAIAKMRVAKLGKKLSDEHREKLSAAQLRRPKHPPRSAEWCENMSIARKGKKHSAETREKMSAAQFARQARERATRLNNTQTTEDMT